MDLQSLANLAEIVGVLLVLSGVVFGVFEIRHYREQRQETAAIEIMRAFQSPQFTHSLRMIMEFEGECRSCREDDMSDDLKECAMLVSTTLEAVGLMVFRRIVPFRLVQQLMGGTIQASWRVLRPHTEMMRERLSRPSIHEWFQWLAERLDAHPEFRDCAGAYEKHRDWQPESQSPEQAGRDT